MSAHTVIIAYRDAVITVLANSQFANICENYVPNLQYSNNYVLH